MGWPLIPAMLGALAMFVFGVGAALKPEALTGIGVSCTSPLGRSEIRAVFGGMFVALGAACLILHDPLVFAVVGSAWLADVAVRSVAVFVDQVPRKEALPVLGIGLAIGLTLLSGYWTA